MGRVQSILRVLGLQRKALRRWVIGIYQPKLQFLKRSGDVILLKPFAKCSPMGLFILNERHRKCFDLQRQFRAPSFKGLTNSGCQLFPLKIKQPRQQPDVVEIFHTTAHQTQLYHRFTLFRDSALSTVAKQSCCWEIQHGRKIQFLGF